MIQADYLGIKLNMHGTDGRLDMFINEKLISWEELQMLRGYLNDMGRYYLRAERKSQDLLRAALNHGGDEELHL